MIGKTTLQIEKEIVVRLSTEVVDSVPCVEETQVLVLHPNYEMAREITVQISEMLPNSHVSYASTVASAKELLHSESFQLIITAQDMRDGNMEFLKEMVQSDAHAPDIIVIGDMNASRLEDLIKVGYEYQEMKKLSGLEPKYLRATSIIEKSVEPSKFSTIAPEGEPIFKPFSDIAAMVFTISDEDHTAVERALEAVEHAAKQLVELSHKIEANPTL